MTVSSPGAPGSRAFGRCRGADELPDDGQGQDPEREFKIVHAPANRVLKFYLKLI